MRLDQEATDELLRRFTAAKEAGEVRAVELLAHPFFVATLFQPELAALSGLHSPVVNAFVASIEI